jgi:predicted esterase
MAAVYACQHPGQVDRLVLLAPALAFLDLEETPLPPTSIPVVIYHGVHDDLVPADRTQDVAEQLFENLTFILVEDGHDLRQTVQDIDWPALLEA